MPAEGMLLQLDASPHRWLGRDCPRWSLLGAVDDATGEPVAALFREQEDAAGYLMLLRQVVHTRGIPAAIYRDRHSIFSAPGTERLSLDEELVGTRLPTQVGRVLADLGIASIPASSPQAKGRIERSWRTHQDRLSAELRLAGICTLRLAGICTLGVSQGADLSLPCGRQTIRPVRVSTGTCRRPTKSDREGERLRC